ncbi:hypothetical protein UFOVP247_186 [uncultured Caudovirales phage]|uniref:Uncharacterized protein n=1 Tax=uncultured Caudovirales phage TaxID=2100421 RepID=A0A6J7WXR3_9CAUD|nr:hypothetical protein UFOVP247_186 [uncultured Caudovirales phage]
MNNSDELACLVVLFCEKRQLDLWSYVDGLISGGEISASLMDTLIRYHREWLA